MKAIFFYTLIMWDSDNAKINEKNSNNCAGIEFEFKLELKLFWCDFR
jgi:hypothetical protein